MANAATTELVRIESRDGTAIGLWRTGTGPSLLAVHGTAADHSAWDPVLPFLVGSFTVYAMDRRGRGASGDSGNYAIEREFEDVASAVDALPGPVHVYGHSFGGAIVAEAALQCSNLGGLVLYEGGPRPLGLLAYPADLIDRLERLVAEGQADEALEVFMLTTAGLGNVEIGVLRGRASWAARVGAAPTIPRELRAINAYDADMRRFRSLQAPTLLVAGSETVGPRRDLLELLLHVLPDVRLAVLPGQKHAAHQVVPELFAGVIRDFLVC